jgi:hypothetical protein
VMVEDWRSFTDKIDRLVRAAEEEERHAAQ